MAEILFIGGTGVISSACTSLAVESGHQLTLFNRGKTKRPIPEGVNRLEGDIRDPASARRALGDKTFDVVVDWVAFTPQHIEMDLALFRGKTDQYIFISSASAYQTPPARLPVTESTPLSNPYWEYSQEKIACEERLTRAYREGGFPVTIVRPSHTYDRTLFPLQGQYTMVNRMRQGSPVLVHGDGTSLWTLTHHRDFAKGFVGLLGNPRAVGEAIQITSDEWLSWNQIYDTIARAVGVEAELIHVPSDFIAAFDAEWGKGLLGDKTHSMIFDNTKIKRLVPDYNAVIPFHTGVEEIMAWYDTDPERQVVDQALDRTIDKIIAAYQSARPDKR